MTARKDDIRHGDDVREYVYFAYCAGFIKIGVTRDPWIRCQKLSSSSPLPVSLLFSIPGNVVTEREYHERFRAHRVGGEWFAFGPELRAFLESELAQVNGGAGRLRAAQDFVQKWLNGARP